MSERKSYTVDMELIQRVTKLVVGPLKELNEVVTKEFPNDPDVYLAFAIGLQGTMLLGNISDPDKRATCAQMISVALENVGYGLAVALPDEGHA